MILAIETTTSASSIAIFDEENIIYHEYTDIKITHSETIMLRIDNALKALKQDKKNLKAVCISNGPGSFTGIRIGLATAKGICTALQIPLIPFNTLQILATNVYGTDKNILSILDARMNEAYIALFDKNLNVLIENHCRKYEDIKNFPATNNQNYPFTNNQNFPFTKGVGAGQKNDCICVGDIHLLTNHRTPNTENRIPLIALPHQNIPQATAMQSLLKLKNIDLTFDIDVINNLEPYYIRSATAQIKK